MGRGTIRSFIAGLVFALVMVTDLPAGPFAEAVGKRWDKFAGKIVKVNEALKPLKPKGKLVKGVAKKVKQAGEGGCCNGK